jgi:hypothetical protein
MRIAPWRPFSRCRPQQPIGASREHEVAVPRESGAPNVVVTLQRGAHRSRMLPPTPVEPSTSLNENVTIPNGIPTTTIVDLPRVTPGAGSFSRESARGHRPPTWRSCAQLADDVELWRSYWWYGVPPPQVRSVELGN